MNYNRLEQNIVDVVVEQQLKLGYMGETVRLYYPLQSLNRLLGTELDSEGMKQELQGFTKSVKERYGALEITEQKDRFCFRIPPQGSVYIHEHADPKGFLFEFIETIRKPGCGLEQVLAVFRKHSKQVHVERTKHGEFDYLVYFEDGVPDDYRYCLTVEGEEDEHGHHGEGHVIYHRFTIEDYEDFHF
jgi:hypothetical protein